MHAALAVLCMSVSNGQQGDSVQGNYVVDAGARGERPEANVLHPGQTSGSLLFH